MRWIILTIVLALVVSVQAEAQELTAVEILEKSDAVVNAPKDQDLKLKLILIDKDGKEKVLFKASSVSLSFKSSRRKREVKCIE